jgi:hypothetical protein
MSQVRALHPAPPRGLVLNAKAQLDVGVLLRRKRIWFPPGILSGPKGTAFAAKAANRPKSAT